jgi:hypothetical protein
MTLFFSLCPLQVVPSPDIRCPDVFELFDPLTGRTISGKVTLINADHPEQKHVILRIPGDTIELSSNFKQGMPQFCPVIGYLHVCVHICYMYICMYTNAFVLASQEFQASTS